MPSLIENPLTESLLIEEVKQKKEFRELPDSLIEKVLLLNKNDVKKTRAVLRKYFTVFITNKLVGGKLSYGEILKKHLSTQERDYGSLYKRILGDEDCIIDLGAGVNGLSVGRIRKKYIAVEAIKYYADLMNKFFSENSVNGAAVWGDLFDLDKIIKIVKSEKRPAVWMFNIIDALELEKGFSKKMILAISSYAEKIVLSFPTRSLKKKRKFSASRQWLLDFIRDNFEVSDNFASDSERFLVIKLN